MILHHIAQSACAFVEAGASLDPERFRRSDLHLVDVMGVPEGRENRVREPQYQNVLRGFLAEEMIDAVSLLFRKGIADDAVELAR